MESFRGDTIILFCGRNTVSTFRTVSEIITKTKKQHQLIQNENKNESEKISVKIIKWISLTLKKLIKPFGISANWMLLAGSVYGPEDTAHGFPAKTVKSE